MTRVQNRLWQCEYQRVRNQGKYLRSQFSIQQATRCNKTNANQRDSFSVGSQIFGLTKCNINSKKDSIYTVAPHYLTKLYKRIKMALRQMSLWRAETGTEVVLDRSTHERRGRGGDERKHADPPLYFGVTVGQMQQKNSTFNFRWRVAEDTDAKCLQNTVAPHTGKNERLE